MKFWSRKILFQSCAFICGSIYNDIIYSTALTAAEHQSDFELTTDTPYLTLTGELWGVTCEDLGENWLCYNSTTLSAELIPTHLLDMASISEITMWRNHGKHCLLLEQCLNWLPVSFSLFSFMLLLDLKPWLNVSPFSFCATWCLAAVQRFLSWMGCGPYHLTMIYHDLNLMENSYHCKFRSLHGITTNFYTSCQYHCVMCKIL